jgi:hypothetical protein
MIFLVNYDGVILICLEPEDVGKALKELYDGLVGGNFMGNTTAHKILRVGYYWPTLFRDAHTYARNCKNFQISARREKRFNVRLQHVVVSRPFDQWGLNVIG